MTPDITQFPIATVGFPIKIVQSQQDLAEYLVGEEYVLPPGAVVFLASPENNGIVDIGDKALRVGTGTVLRGLADCTILSTNPVSMVRANDIDSNCIIREVNFYNPVGAVFDLSHSQKTYQVNMVFCGVIGADAGTITGWDVQSIKGCFIACNKGVKFAGATNKVFINESPFYNTVAGEGAVTFTSTLNVEAVDIVTPYFKSEPGSVGIVREEGAYVGFGKLRGSTIFGDVTPLVGITPADTNWFMTDNDGVRNSKEAGEAYVSQQTTIFVNNTNAYTPITTGVNLAPESERFVLGEDNDLVYTGKRPVLVQFASTLSINPNNNEIINIAVFKNGVIRPESVVEVAQGAGVGSFPRTISASLILSLEEGDRVGLRFANTQSTRDIELRTCSFLAKS